MSENLSVFMYGGIDKNGAQHIKEESEYQIPKINDGYYYFIDDYAKSSKDINDIYSDKKLFDRYSYNFTLTIYDIEKNYLYYYEIDT